MMLESVGQGMSWLRAQLRRIETEGAGVPSSPGGGPMALSEDAVDKEAHADACPKRDGMAHRRRRRKRARAPNLDYDGTVHQPTLESEAEGRAKQARQDPDRRVEHALVHGQLWQVIDPIRYSGGDCDEWGYWLVDSETLHGATMVRLWSFHENGAEEQVTTADGKQAHLFEDIEATEGYRRLAGECTLLSQFPIEPLALMVSPLRQHWDRVRGLLKQ